MCKWNFTHLASIFERNRKQRSVTISSSLLALSSILTRTHIIPLASGCLHPYHSLTAGSQCFGSHKAPQYPSISVAFLYTLYIYSRTQTPVPVVSLSQQMQKPSTARPFRAVLEHPRVARCSPAGTGTALSKVLIAADRTRGAGGVGREMKFHRLAEYSALEGTHKDHRAQLLYRWPIQGLNPRSRCYKHHGLTTQPTAGSGMPYCHYGCSGKQMTFYRNETFYVLSVKYFTRVWLFCLSCLW